MHRYEYVDRFDIVKSLGIHPIECPTIVYLPISYAMEVGNDYLNNPSLDGIKVWKKEDSANNNWKEWLWGLMKVTLKVCFLSFLFYGERCKA